MALLRLLMLRAKLTWSLALRLLTFDGIADTAQAAFEAATSRFDQLSGVCGGDALPSPRTKAVIALIFATMATGHSAGRGGSRDARRSADAQCARLTATAVN